MNIKTFGSVTGVSSTVLAFVKLVLECVFDISVFSWSGLVYGLMGFIV